MFSRFHSLAFLMVTLFLMLSSTHGETANYTLDCWLSGNKLYNRMGIAKSFRSMPDIFVVVDIEGKGRFLPPFIEREYKGQQLLINFQAPKPGFNDKIIVSFYRDRSVSNHIWNRLLQTRLDGRFTASQVTGEWHIQLANEDLPLSPPELLTQAILMNPFSLSYEFSDTQTKKSLGEVKLKIE